MEPLGSLDDSRRSRAIYPTSPPALPPAGIETLPGRRPAHRRLVFLVEHNGHEFRQPSTTGQELDTQEFPRSNSANALRTSSSFSRDTLARYLRVRRLRQWRARSSAAALRRSFRTRRCRAERRTPPGVPPAAPSPMARPDRARNQREQEQARWDVDDICQPLTSKMMKSRRRGRRGSTPELVSNVDSARKPSSPPAQGWRLRRGRRHGRVSRWADRRRARDMNVQRLS
jgi:hypothetical protein